MAVQERIEQRVSELKADYEAGETKLVELDAQRVEIEQSQERLNSIIEVLDELLDDTDDDAGTETSTNGAGDVEAADDADDTDESDDTTGTDEADAEPASHVSSFGTTTWTPSSGSLSNNF